MTYLDNDFSLQMLHLEHPVEVHVSPVTEEEIPSTAVSVVGHQDTANVVADILGFSVQFNRKSICLEEGDELFVAQITGGRLPEGATTLPEGFTLKFFRVTVGT